MTDDRVIGTISARNGYDGLVEALRARRDELGLNQLMIDELSGLTPGYSGKLLGAAQIKQFGVSALLAIIATLGLRFDVVIDSQQEELMRPHWEPGQHAQRRIDRLAPIGERSLNRMMPLVAREMGRRGGLKPMPAHALKNASKIASKGGKARARKMTRLQRQQSARKAAIARWAKRNAHRDILIV